jgi:lysophospholipase L1-like esterase
MTSYIWRIVATVLIGVLGYVLMTTPLIRYLKTGWLILRVEPYQQAGTDAGAILVIGDSTAYGTGAKRPAESVAGLVGQSFPNYQVKTVAENGATISGVTELLRQASPLDDYALILIQAGGNDILQKRSLTDIEQDTRVLLSEAIASAVPVVMMTAGNVGAAAAFASDGVPDAEYEAQSRAVLALLERLAIEYGVTFVSLFEEPDIDVFLKEPKRYLAADGLHPSSAGYQQWFTQLRPVLEKNLAP